MVTVFNEPMEDFEWYDSEEDVRFEASASGKTEIFKIVITGIEGNLVRAETVSIDPDLLSAQAPEPIHDRMTIGYSPVPSAFEKVKLGFDATRGFTLAEKEIYSPSGQLREKTVVREFSLVDGTWIPSRLEREHYQNGNVRMREEIAYSEMREPDDIDDSRFRIDFPPGTHITDEVIRMSLNPDEPAPLDVSALTISEDEGEMDISFKVGDATRAAAQRAIGSGDTDMAMDSTPSEPQARRSLRPYLWAGGCVLPLLVVCAVLVGKRAATKREVGIPKE